MLPINSLLKERSGGVIWRVLDELASGETKDATPTHFVLIDIHAAKASPIFVGKLKTLKRIADGELTVIDEVFAPVNLEALTEYDRALVARRWRLIQVVRRRLGQRVWGANFRGRLARRCVNFRALSKPFFYETLRRYWQRGQTKEALATDMWRCGAPGDRRVAAPEGKKTGRTRSIQPGVGVSATQEHRRNMQLAWSSAPVGRDGRNLRKAWEWMLITCYEAHVTVLPKKGENHQVRVEHYDRVPTFEQFEYHWKKEHSFDIQQLKRLQKKRFDLAFKPLLSGTLPEVRGPGTRYYIDATVLDVYVVSRLNPRRIVGRPTLYVVIDQFSRMVVGIYVGLEPPSWAGSMLALWNCSVDKVALCKSYGIDIKPEQWPTGYMPLHLMGDRGELKSEDADRLSVGFGLDVENARGYSGDAKGVVERVFRTLQAIFGPFMPGFLDKFLAGRDQEPAILRTALKLDTVICAVINAVLIANTRVVRDYAGWPEVIASGVPFVPASLWKWGVENLRSDVRSYPDLHLKKYLWPEVEMKVTRRGLQLHRGVYFMGEEARNQSWFAHALHRKEDVKALYHPNDSSSAIVLPSSQRGQAWDVSLARRCAKWSGFAFSEIRALEHQKKLQNAAAESANLPDRLSASKRIIEDARDDRRRAEAAKPRGETRAERTRDIRANREDELLHMTAGVLQATTFTPAQTPQMTREKVVVPAPSPAAHQTIPPAAPMPSSGPSVPSELDAAARTAARVRELRAKRAKPPSAPSR